MTKAEYEAVECIYLKLLNKKDRTELEEAKYLYCDKIMNYVSLRATAREMGNKNPDDNWIIKRAKENIEIARRNLQEVVRKQNEN